MVVSGISKTILKNLEQMSRVHLSCTRADRDRLHPLPQVRQRMLGLGGEEPHVGQVGVGAVAAEIRPQSATWKSLARSVIIARRASWRSPAPFRVRTCLE